MIAYGPVPSRRLGRSLGINNIPPKICTYSCVYCQVGRTLQMETEPRAFYQPRELTAEVCQKVEATRQAGKRIDYLSFVPDGEPTLDANLGEEIQAMGGLCLPAAVIYTGDAMRQVVLHPGEDGQWVAEVPSLPGCISQGATKEAAIENVKDAIQAWIEAAKDMGDEVPDDPLNAEIRVVK
jgi:predicted RNase H-like HicB family nuclease